MRQPRAGNLNAVGPLVSGENNELTSGTVIDVGGVQVYKSIYGGRCWEPSRPRAPAYPRCLRV